MPLQSSGQISLDDLHVEAGGTSGTECSMNDSDIRGLVGASANSQMTFGSFYGASNAQTFMVQHPLYTYYTSYDGTASSPTTTSSPSPYPYNLMVVGVVGLNHGSYSTSFSPPQGTISSRNFMGQTSQLWTGFRYQSNPGGTGFTMWSINNPASTATNNSGWNTVTLSAYGTAYPLGVQTTRTYSITVSRTQCAYFGHPNTAPYNGYAPGYNNRWRHFISPYSSSNPSYTGDSIGLVVYAAKSSANNNAGITITYT